MRRRLSRMVAFVVAPMTNVQTILWPWGPAFMDGVLILLLFVLSAAVVGSLIFGRPAYLYFSGAKRDGGILVSSIVPAYFGGGGASR